MKVLFVCHRFPFPPNRGGKIRPFNILSHLSREHEVYVASLVRSKEELVAGQGLQEHCAAFVWGACPPVSAYAKMMINLVRRTPSSMGYFHSRKLSKEIGSLTACHQFDLVFVHCSSVSQYVENIRGPKKIIDFGDMDSQKWLEYERWKPFPLNLGYRLEGVKMRAAEARIAQKYDLCTATTLAEEETLSAIAPDKPTNWFPNGVDSEFFKPSGMEYDPDLISFIGRMDYFPNQQCVLEFVRDVFPKIRNERASARFIIVGAAPSREIRELGNQSGVEVTGFVDDVRPCVERSAVNIATLRIARGTQNKMLEAMALGVPVVATSIASKGVDCTPGEHVIVADNSEDQANAILSVMSDKSRRSRLSAAARERVLSNHSWAGSMSRLDDILRELMEAPL